MTQHAADAVLPLSKANSEKSRPGATVENARSINRVVGGATEVRIVRKPGKEDEVWVGKARCLHAFFSSFFGLFYFIWAECWGLSLLVCLGVYSMDRSVGGPPRSGVLTPSR